MELEKAINSKTNLDLDGKKNWAIKIGFGTSKYNNQTTSKTTINQI